MDQDMIFKRCFFSSRQAQMLPTIGRRSLDIQSYPKNDKERIFVAIGNGTLHSDISNLHWV